MSPYVIAKARQAEQRVVCVCMSCMRVCHDEMPTNTSVFKNHVKHASGKECSAAKACTETIGREECHCVNGPLPVTDPV